MSLETFPSHRPDAEPKVDQATVDEINSAERNDDREVSPTGSRLLRAANRVNSLLETRAMNKVHSEALAENVTRDRETQDEAFASYEDNVSVTTERENLENEWAEAKETRLGEQHSEALSMNKEMDKTARREARAEKVANAKESLKLWGATALESTKKSWAATKSGAETAALYTLITADKVKDAARTAQVRVAERAAYREDAARKVSSQEDAFASYEDNVTYSNDYEEALGVNDQKKADQNDAFASYDENIAYSNDHEEALEMNAQKKADQEAAYDSYGENIDATALREAWNKAKDAHMNHLHGEALDMNAEFDENAARESAIKLAQAARLAKLRRQKIRRERFDRAVDIASVAGQAAKKFTKKFGRSIAKFTMRSAKVVAGATRGAVQGARASYQETAK